MGTHWQTLGDPPPAALEDARVQLHHAAQAVAAVGHTYLEPSPDGAQASLRWHDGLGALVGREADVARPFAAALRVAEPALLLLDADEKVAARLPLRGRGRAEAFAWLEQAIREHDGETRPLVHPRFDLPAHPVDGGAPFTADPGACAELARWISNADRLLSQLARGSPGATPARCSPERLAVETRILVEDAGSRPPGKSIRLALVCGDEHDAAPYWLVELRPPPKQRPLPPLEAGGVWHVHGWVGAVLPGHEAAAPGDQEARVRAFLGAGFTTARALLA